MEESFVALGEILGLSFSNVIFNNVSNRATEVEHIYRRNELDRLFDKHVRIWKLAKDRLYNRKPLTRQYDPIKQRWY